MTGYSWAPPFPRWLDRPGFWDEAQVYYHPFQPLFSVALVDAPRRRAALHPQLPPQWQRVSAKRLRAGDASVNAVIEQGVESTRVTVESTGARVTVDDGGVNPRIVPGEHHTRYAVDVPMSGAQRKVQVTWQGGLAVVEPTHALQPGQESHGLRVVDFRFDAGEWALMVEGSGGRNYELAVLGEHIGCAAGARIGEVSDGTTMLQIDFGERAGRVLKVIRLSR